MSISVVQDEFAPAAGQLEMVHGRSIAVNPLHAPPIDAEEHRRLDMQHEMQTRMFRGLFPMAELILPVLNRTDNRVTRILDIGTGSGAWAIDMAKEFPHSEVLGLDLVPPTSLNAHPPNVRFVAHDVNFPLPVDTGSVDLVHARLVDAGIRHYPEWLSEVARVLSPGGVYLVIAADDPLVQEGRVEIPSVPIGEPGYCAVQNILGTAINSVKVRAGGVIASQHWLKLLSDNGHFDKVGRNKDELAPIGPWPKDMDENTRIIADIMRRNMLTVIRAQKPWMLTDGHDEAKVDRWIEDATSELSELRVRIFVKFKSAWAIRSANLWKPYEKTGIPGEWATTLDHEPPEQYTPSPSA